MLHSHCTKSSLPAMSSFTVLVTVLLVANAAAKQPCPVCKEDIKSTGIRNPNLKVYSDRSCSEAVDYRFNKPCPEGAVCELFEQTVSARSSSGGYHAITTQTIDCFEPTPSYMRSCGPDHSMYGVHRSCGYKVLFSPDRCPSCIIAEGRINGQELKIFDNCVYDADQWESCDPGYSCNFLKLVGYFWDNPSNTMTVYIMNCRLTDAICEFAKSQVEESFEGLTISSCGAYDFPADYEE